MIRVARLLTCIAFPLLACIPASAMAQTSALIFQSEPGDTFGKGSSQSWTAPAAAFRVVRIASDNHVSVRVDAPGFFAELSFTAPLSAEIVPGSYTGALRYPESRLAGLWIQATGHFCYVPTGRFLVREIEYGSGNSVLRLAIDVEQHCTDEAPAFFAAVRYNSTVPTDMFPGGGPRYSLAMSVSAGGFVTGGGLACGAGQTACSTPFTSATRVALTAAPLDGYLFNGWTGGCAGAETTTVHVNTVRECGATFIRAADTQPRTRLTVNSATRQDYVGAGIQSVYSPANSIWIADSYVDQVTIRVFGSAEIFPISWSIDFTAPLGRTLQPGYYPNAVRSRPSLSNGLFVVRDRQQCDELVGDYTIHQYVHDPYTGKMVAFAADFTQRCAGSSEADVLRGHVEYQTTSHILTSCTTPDPFLLLGGGTCVNGGWLPPGIVPPLPASPPAQPPPAPPTTGGCTTPDPFAGIGGGTCHNGGWMPPGMTPPGGGSTPPPTPQPPTPTPTPSPAGCASADPFAAMGGGTCFNGGWLPPGMSPPGGGTSPPPPPPSPTTPPVSTGTCSTTDPFAAIGGGTCYNGGWLPPGMPIPGGGGQ